MSLRFTSRTLFGATAMLTFGAALAMAQDTSRTRPRSDRRLPISKEAAGEVVREIVRTDTVMIYRTDTVQLTRRDTVRITRTRIDTVIPRLPKYPYPAGFYGGAAGGFSTPTGSLYAPNSTGGTAQIQLGWNNAKQVLGLRFDWNGAWPGEDTRFGLFQGQASLQNFSLSGKVQWPFHFGGEKLKAKTDPCDPATTYSRGPLHRFAIYGIGGFTYTTHRNLPIVLDREDINDLDFNDFNDVDFSRDGERLAIINADTLVFFNATNRDLFIAQRSNVFLFGDDNWHGRGGWNAGGGVSMFWGSTELFVEARVMGFKPRSVLNIRPGQARQVPVVFGLNWYTSRM